MCVARSVPLRNTDASALIPLWGIHTLLSLLPGVKKRHHPFNRWNTHRQRRAVCFVGCVEVCVGLAPSPRAHSSLGATEHHQHQQQMYSHIHTGVPRGPTEEVEVGKNTRWVSFTILKNCASSWDVKSKFSQVEFRGSWFFATTLH